MFKQETFYKVGDIVTVRSDLSCNGTLYSMYDNPKDAFFVTAYMNKFAGQQLVITKIKRTGASNKRGYILEGVDEGCFWTDEMLEYAPPHEVLESDLFELLGNS